MPRAADTTETETSPIASAGTAHRSGLTARAVLLGLLAVLVTVWMVSYAELVTGQIMIGYLQVPPVVVFLLFLVAGVNMAVRRHSPGKELRPPELATIYVMMLPAAMISSHGLLQRVLPVMVAGNYFATRANNWQNVFFLHTPGWIVPWDPHGGVRQPITKWFFEGLRRGQPLPWQPWIAPLAAWLALMALVYGAFLCMAAILRKQWVDSERLSFPLVQLPLELIGMRGETGRDGASSLFTSPLGWAGFALPFIVFNINGLHNVIPISPSIPLYIGLNSYMPGAPWNTISYFVLNISFMAIGFFYLLPTELLFSLWFFYLLGKGEEVFAATIGYQTPGAPHAAVHTFIGAQTEGAWLVLVVVYFLLARPHLAAVWRAAVSSKAKERGEGEMLSYRAAFWGLILCCAGIVVWCAAAGMSAWLAALVFGLYLFVQAIIMARSTAEAGMIMTEGSWTPTDILQLSTPYYSLGGTNLTVLSYTDAVFPRDLRGIIFTAFLDSERLADGVGLGRRPLLWALVIGMLVAVVSGAALQLWLPYHHGALSLYDYTYQGNDQQFFTENAAAIRTQNMGAARGAGVFVLTGAVITACLSLLRARFAWWPLHPLGYALSATWTVVVFWFPMFIAWLVKSLVMRYGGMRMYRILRPLFIGMVLGELTAAVEWTLISMATHCQAPFFPWP
ncbi:MAG TPA: DUF6785 family protein [Capsulimonadaceae bacterium]|nr:DUF6785 family protein [Capsulimonadaceae bacterium]